MTGSRKAPPPPGQGSLVHATATIGADVTIEVGVNVGFGAVVRDGSVVREDVPALAVVEGDPARVVSYAHDQLIEVGPAGTPAPGSALVRVLPEINQSRGSTVVIERGDALGFSVERCLVVTGVPSGSHRGNHAHRTLDELVVCVAGSCTVLVDDGLGHREAVVLGRPGVAVAIPPYVWTAQFGHTPDAALVVLSSAPYDPADYISDYDLFLTEVRAQ